MKPLEPESRRLIEEINAADIPPHELEARVWRTLEGRLTQSLPPTAAAASRALGAQSTAVGTGLKLSLAVVGLGMAAAFVVVHLYAPLRPQPTREPPSPHAVPETVQPTPTVPPARVAVEESTLLEETLLLAKAQSAISAGVPGRALPWIEQHRARFSHGELAQERDAAEVFALCALHRTASARRARLQFLRVWPDSPLADRVRGACSGRP